MGEPLPRTALQILLSCLEMKSDSIPARLNLAVVPDHPDGLVIEPGIRRPVIRDEVQVPEQQPLYVRIPGMLLHRSPQDRQVVFMNHFIGLDVEGPITRTVGKSDIGLLRIDQAALSERFIPD